MNKGLVLAIVKQTFDSYDKDKSGYLDKSEIKDLIKTTFHDKSLKFKNMNSDDYEKLLDKDCQKLLAKIDQNSDGKVSLEELNDLMGPLIEDILNQGQNH